MNEKDRDDRSRLKPVAEGITNKKTLGEKLSDTFLANDVHSVKRYFLEAAKNLTRDFAVGLIFDIMNFAFYNRGGAGYRNNPGNIGAFIGNNRPTYNYSTSLNSVSQQPTTNKLSYKDVKFSDRGSAEAVCLTLKEALRTYNKGVTIGDFYDAANLGKTAEPSDYDWGWTNLDSAMVRPAGGYWVIDFPNPIPLVKH